MTKAKIDTLEEQFKTMQKHFGALVMTVKDLKCSVDALNKKVEGIQHDEVKEIIKNQRMLEKGILEHTEAIKQLDEELERANGGKEVIVEPKKTVDKVEDVKISRNKIKKCRYFNRGFCKYKTKCRFFHPRENCPEYMKTYKCEVKDCQLRHPKQCKWLSTDAGCKRGSECSYLHDALVRDDVTAVFKCEGCKDVWTEENYVVQHIINGQRCYFCLNCEEWICDKARVFDEGFTLLDEAGNLRYNI